MIGNLNNDFHDIFMDHCSMGRVRELKEMMSPNILTEQPILRQGLVHAAYFGNENIVLFLLGVDKDWGQFPKKLNQAFIFAVSGGYPSCARTLWPLTDLSAQDKDAAITGSVNGADLETVRFVTEECGLNSDVKKALCVAVEREYRDIFTHLLPYALVPDLASEALITSIFRKKPDMFFKILERVPKDILIDPEAICYAAQHKDTKMFLELLPRTDLELALTLIKNTAHENYANVIESGIRAYQDKNVLSEKLSDLKEKKPAKGLRSL